MCIRCDKNLNVRRHSKNVYRIVKHGQLDNHFHICFHSKMTFFQSYEKSTANYDTAWTNASALEQKAKSYVVPETYVSNI